LSCQGCHFTGKDVLADESIPDEARLELEIPRGGVFTLESVAVSSVSIKPVGHTSDARVCLGVNNVVVSLFQVLVEIFEQLPRRKPKPLGNAIKRRSGPDQCRLRLRRLRDLPWGLSRSPDVSVLIVNSPNLILPITIQSKVTIIQIKRCVICA
jgi:hypothetical protein